VAKSGSEWEIVESSRAGQHQVEKAAKFTKQAGKRGDLGHQIPSFRSAAAMQSIGCATVKRSTAKGE
jgi:hypothetical protein